MISGPIVGPWSKLCYGAMAPQLPKEGAHADAKFRDEAASIHPGAAHAQTPIGNQSRAGGCESCRLNPLGDRPDVVPWIPPVPISGGALLQPYTVILAALGAYRLWMPMSLRTAERSS
jgi:hypothetical protein